MADPDIERLVAPNPGPMTLEGTNTYLVGRGPTIVIDPGPADDSHIEAVRAAAEARGGIGAVLLTHSHDDHAGGVERLGVKPEGGHDAHDAAGLSVIPTPGHAEDHVCFFLEREHPAAGRTTTCFTGDLILGEGSTIVPPREHGGSLADYLASLHRLNGMSLDLLLPGHGPEIRDPHAKINEYLAHRQERQNRLEAALDRGERSRTALLAEVWDDVPEQLRGAAAVAMQSHLELLEDEGRLPADLRD
jgi:glyoxylase-like metal-dependent hydrolase (beta-lactamase superfamily II)